MSQTIQPKSALVAKAQPLAAALAAPAVTPHKAPLGLRTVAIFEFFKGLVVLIAGLGLLSLVHRDAEQIAEELVRLIGVNPAHRYPQIFIDAASHLDDARLWFLSAAALVYSTVRFVETYGLWHELPWAEWFAVISASLYLPVELYHLYEKPGVLSLLVPLVNVGIVIYLAYLLATNSARNAKPNPGP